MWARHAMMARAVPARRLLNSSSVTQVKESSHNATEAGPILAGPLDTQPWDPKASSADSNLVTVTQRRGTAAGLGASVVAAVTAAARTRARRGPQGSDAAAAAGQPTRTSDALPGGPIALAWQPRARPGHRGEPAAVMVDDGPGPQAGRRPEHCPPAAGGRRRPGHTGT